MQQNPKTQLGALVVYPKNYPKNKRVLPNNVLITKIIVPNEENPDELEERLVLSPSDFKRALEEIIPQEPENIVVTVKGTDNSGLPNGEEAKLLLGSKFAGRIKHFDELGIEYVKLNGAERQALDISLEDGELLFRNNRKDASFYVTAVETSALGPNQATLRVGDVISSYGEERALLGHEERIPIVRARVFKSPSLEEYLEEADSDQFFFLNIYRNGSYEIVPRFAHIREYYNRGNQGLGPYSYLPLEINEAGKKELGLQENDSGVYIYIHGKRLETEHPYALKSGMVVTALNGKKVVTAKDIKAEIVAARLKKKVLIFEVLGNRDWKYPGYRKLIISRTHMD